MEGFVRLFATIFPRWIAAGVKWPHGGATEGVKEGDKMVAITPSQSRLRAFWET